jgi:hypothetical protein
MACTDPMRKPGGRGTASTRARRGLQCLAVGLSAWLALAHPAHAADSSEFWPEVNAFVTLDPRTRLFLDAAHADGKESDASSLDLAAYLDISLKPIVKKLRTEDWQRSRYFWARIGYERIFKNTGGSGEEVSENRGIVSVYGKAALPAEVWLEARGRADLRWATDAYSSRYRIRAEITREFTVLDHTVVPYFNVELFYDTRYGGWARTLYQLGPEVTVSRHFRYEIYFARQNDRLPKQSDLNALGVNFKWYD